MAPPPGRKSDSIASVRIIIYLTMARKAPCKYQTLSKCPRLFGAQTVNRSAGLFIAPRTRGFFFFLSSSSFVLQLGRLRSLALIVLADKKMTYITRLSPLNAEEHTKTTTGFTLRFSEAFAFSFQSGV